MMITKGQLRAAMAWLKVSGKDLAEEVGMSANAMNTFLRDEEAGTAPRKFRAIVTSLESKGIEFTPDNGVRLKG